MNSYNEFLMHSQNYYKNYSKKCCHDSHGPVLEASFNDHEPKEEQRHVHEFLGSTKLAEEGRERHDHRFAGVSGQAIPTPDGNHIHEVFTNTDFFDHFHVIQGRSGPAIEVGDGRHVHFARGFTTVNDGHAHEFTFASLIESPSFPDKC